MIRWLERLIHRPAREMRPGTSEKMRRSEVEAAAQQARVTRNAVLARINASAAERTIAAIHKDRRS